MDRKRKRVSITASVLLVVMLATAGLFTAVYSLIQNVDSGGWWFNGNVDAPPQETQEASELVDHAPGTGLAYFLSTEHVENINAYVIGADGVVTSTVGKTLVSKTTVANPSDDTSIMPHLTYVINQGEFLRDTFYATVWHVINFYPEPDTSIVGIEKNNIYGQGTHLRFFGKTPGTTTFAMGGSLRKAPSVYTGAADNDGVMNEKAIKVTITVLENKNYKPFDQTFRANLVDFSDRIIDTSKNMVSNTTSVSLTSLLKNATGYEVMGVVDGNGFLNREHFSTPIRPLAIDNTVNIGERKGNTGFAFSHRTSAGDLSDVVSVEVIVKDANGFIYNIPVVAHHNGLGLNKGYLTPTQAYLRTGVGAGLTTSTADISVSMGYIDTTGKTFLNDANQNQNTSMFVSRTSIGGSIPQFPTTLRWSGLQVHSTPVAAVMHGSLRNSAFTAYANAPGGGYHHIAEYFIVNYPGWSTYAPKPKEYTGTIGGTSAGYEAGDSATYKSNYPTIQLNSDTKYQVIAEDFAKVESGWTMEIAKIHSYDVGALQVEITREGGKNRLNVAIGEDYRNGPFYKDRASVVLEVSATNGTDKMSSYITVYFKLSSGMTYTGEAAEELINQVPQPSNNGSNIKEIYRGETATYSIKKSEGSTIATDPDGDEIGTSKDVIKTLYNMVRVVSGT